MRTEGLLDTNVVIHAFTSDEHAEECRAFLRALENDTVRARLEPLVLHELSYALPHYLKQLRRDRDELGRVLLMVLSWSGVIGDKAEMTDAVERWVATPGLSFTDAWLAALATRDEVAVYTKNVRELSGEV